MGFFTGLLSAWGANKDRKAAANMSAEDRKFAVEREEQSRNWSAEDYERNRAAFKDDRSYDRTNYEGDRDLNRSNYLEDTARVRGETVSDRANQFSDLRKSAEAGGFNPLTALGAGGGAGFSGGGAPQSGSMGPGGGAQLASQQILPRSISAPPLASFGMVSQGLGEAADALWQTDAEKLDSESQRLSNELAKIQIDQSRNDLDKVGPKRPSTDTGSVVTEKQPKLGRLGGEQNVPWMQYMDDNPILTPYPVEGPLPMKPDRHVAGKQAAEDRIGEVASEGFGAIAGAVDLNTHRIIRGLARTRGVPFAQSVFDNYQNSIDDIEQTLAWMMPGRLDSRAKLAHGGQQAPGTKTKPRTGLRFTKAPFKRTGRKLTKEERKLKNRIGK